MNDVMTTMLQTLEKHLNTKTIMGEPFTVGDVTLIPVMDLMFGFGGGGGEGVDPKSESARGSGSGGGAGARLAPKAMVVIKGGDVQVIPLTRGSAIEKIVEAIPGLLEKLPSKGAKKEEVAAE
ncbi:MAG: GerW family sporulation protein [Bacillota bacterium]